MLVQDIFLAITRYESNNFDDEDYTENLVFLKELHGYILSGEYTQRRNANQVLKYWSVMTNTQIAKEIAQTRQSIGLIKSSISKDLEKELGSNFITLFRAKNFKEMKYRLNKAKNRNNIGFETIVLSELLSQATKNSEKDLEKMKSLYNVQSKKQFDGLIKDSIEQNIDEENIFYKELNLLKKYNALNLEKDINEVNSYVLLKLIDILRGKTGSVEKRNTIQEFIIKDLD